MCLPVKNVFVWLRLVSTVRKVRLEVNLERELVTVIDLRIE